MSKAMKQLTWLELSAVKDGTRLIFAQTWHTHITVPQGTTVAVKENGLNEIWCAMLLTPDDKKMRDSLTRKDDEFSGHIHIAAKANPGCDDPEHDEDWNSPSPLALLN